MTFMVSLLSTLTDFTHCSSVSIVDFEQMPPREWESYTSETLGIPCPKVRSNNRSPVLTKELSGKSKHPTLGKIKNFP